MLNKIFNKKERKPAPEMVLSQNVAMSRDFRATRKNCNVLVVGSDRQQRNAHYTIPNLAKMDCSYVIMDDTAAEHTIQDATEQTYRDNGYDIKVFDVVHPENSLQYNPFVYIREDEDILTLVDTMTQNFHKDSVVSKDFELARIRRFLLQSIAFYLYKDCNQSDWTLANILKLLECTDDNNEYEDCPTVLDIMMSDLKKKDPEHLAVKQYENFLAFKKDKPEDAKKVIIDARANLQLFKLETIKSLTSTNQLDLASIGLKPTVLYVKYSSGNTAWSYPLIPVLLTQLFEALYRTAWDSCASHALPAHVRIFLNNFGVYGAITDFEKIMATMRPYNISCNILTDDLGAIKKTYPDAWQSIVGNCDTLIYLADTNDVPEFFTKMVESGKTGWRRTDVAIEKFGRWHVKEGRTKPIKFKDTPAQIKKGAKPLTTPEQLDELKSGDCAIIIKGCVPFVDKVYGNQNGGNGIL